MPLAYPDTILNPSEANIPQIAFVSLIDSIDAFLEPITAILG